MVLSQTQASSEFPVQQGDQEAPFRGERATISEEKIPHTHTMMMGRAEDMKRRLDETTKTGSAASVASAQLKGELFSPSLQAHPVLVQLLTGPFSKVLYIVTLHSKFTTEGTDL